MRRAALARLRAILPGASIQDADEVTQRVLARLAAEAGRSLAAFEGRSRLGTWLVALTLREATDFARGEDRARTRTRRAALAPRPQPVPTPLEQLLLGEDLTLLRKALASLPGRDRLLLHLVYWETLSYREVAGIIGVAEGSVSPLLERARMALRGTFR